MNGAEVSFRQLAVLLHRWAGLTVAAFLIVSGLTGAVISWDHELDEWLNPHLTSVADTGTAKNALSLVDAIHANYPQVEITYFEFASEPGHSLYYWVEPRVNPDTEQLYQPGFNQIYINPVTGRELGHREWGAVWPITSETFVSFLYKLHFSLHIPEFFGTDHWGIWLLGVVALIWTLDCFTGFYLTLPARRRLRTNTHRDEQPAEEPVTTHASFLSRWRPAWKIRWRNGRYKLNFDLHRAFSLWTWLLLFIIAFTAFSLNLYREIFYPVMTAISDVTPTPFDERTPSGMHKPRAAKIDFADAIGRAEREAAQRGWQKPAGSLWHAREYGIYRVEFFTPEEGHGAGGVGHPAIYLDTQDGRILGEFMPWQGTAADLFVQAQFPIHSGRILGLPGRILISIMGLVVAMLSITGVIIWWRKYSARTATASEVTGRAALQQC